MVILPYPSRKVASREHGINNVMREMLPPGGEEGTNGCKGAGYLSSPSFPAQHLPRAGAFMGVCRNCFSNFIVENIVGHSRATVLGT